MNLIQCPACKSQDHHHEVDDRYQCDRCHWRFIVDEAGIPRDMLPITTAGRKRPPGRKVLPHNDRLMTGNEDNDLQSIFITPHFQKSVIPQDPTFVTLTHTFAGWQVIRNSEADHRWPAFPRKGKLSHGFIVFCQEWYTSRSFHRSQWEATNGLSRQDAQTGRRFDPLSS